MRNLAGALLYIIAFVPLSAMAGSVLNPDVRQNTIDATICVSGYTRTVRPSTSYTNSVKRMLLRKSGVNEDRMSKYELDHIVPLALGGHPRNLDNLALQARDGSNGAHRKDRLEVKLQFLVCTGQVPLHLAQDTIFQDWQGAYHRFAQMKRHRPRRPDAAP